MPHFPALLDIFPLWQFHVQPLCLHAQGTWPASDNRYARQQGSCSQALVFITINCYTKKQNRAAGFFHHWPLPFLGARWHYIHEKKMLQVIMLTRRCYFHLITLFGALFDVQNTPKIMKCFGSWLMAGKVQTLH